MMVHRIKQTSSSALLQHPPKPKSLIGRAPRAPALRVRTHSEVTSAVHDPSDVFLQFLKSLLASCNGQHSIVLI
jgi:hypothetical protein